MKNFRRVVMALLAAIILLFAGNICYLWRLYGSIKSQYMMMARECIVQVDFIEILSRLKRETNYPDSGIKVNVALDITRRMFESGYMIPAYEHSADYTRKKGDKDERLLGLFESFHTTLAYNLRKQTKGLDSKTDYAFLDSIFRAELNHIGLYPKRVAVVPGDSVPAFPTRGMWRIDYSIFRDSPVIYTVYMSPPLGSILRQTAGVVVTTALVILALAFAFIYLIRTVMKMRTIEEMKDDFTNNMTHELKTPIAASYSAIDTLLNYGKHSDPAKRERYLKLALEQLSRLSELVESILSMSMDRRKRITLNNEKIKVQPFVSELASICKLKAPKPVEMDVEVEPSGLEIEVDPTHFANVINNLLDNAVKYSGEQVRIRICVDCNGMEVEDNGIGIPAKSLPMIFNKFYRVLSGNRQDVRGYGIGLYYVRTILGEMGWDISVTSTVGKGTVFKISFTGHK